MATSQPCKRDMRSRRVGSGLENFHGQHGYDIKPFFLFIYVVRVRSTSNLYFIGRMEVRGHDTSHGTLLS